MFSLNISKYELRYVLFLRRRLDTNNHGASAKCSNPAPSNHRTAAGFMLSQ